ncbi:tetratricopeptide repeat protein [bacterium]|nr:MAG: tetratricopeptide repeat protein [bacterium]
MIQLSLQVKPVITFLASDVEGSTRLWESQPEAMSKALLRHDAILRQAIEEKGGRVFKTVGDGFFASFEHVADAVESALVAQQALATQSWETDRPIKVRMAVHAGPAEVRDGDYFGPTLNRLARLLAIGHGGQVLLSETSTALVREGLPPGCELRDAGRHRLKDLESPEAVSMLLHPSLGTSFPPLRSLDSLPNNLPRQTSSFIGRDDERRLLAQTLTNSALVTLTGPGGTGKTRLALQVAADAMDAFPDGVWLVELGPLTDPALVPQAIATAVGIREGTNLSVTKALVEALRDRRTLILLDNCEHLVSACAEMVEELLRVAPRLKVIATSREPLNVRGEVLVQVPSLAVGTGRIVAADEALRLDAVRLLVDRAQAANSRFEFTDRQAAAAVSICRRLDGIPLAIELAASRTRALSLEQIVERLEDRFRLLTAGSRTALPRQQTLRATIDWSFDLLDSQDQTLLRRVAVFAGGWTLDAAEIVCEGDGLEGWEVLDGLMRLVEKSLVVSETAGEDARYRLLESVRQYGIEKLESEEEQRLRERHARHYAALVVRAEDGLQGPEQATWLERLEREHDNIRATLAFCQTHPELCEYALSLMGAIGRFWTVRGYLSEGREWIESILACAPKGATEAKANAWRTAGQLAYWQGDSAAGRRFGEESLKICRELGDRGGETRSLFRLGFACLSEGDLPPARDYFEQALRLGIEIDDRPGIPHLLNAVGEVAYAEGNLDEAKQRFEDALWRFREAKDMRSIASVLKNLSNVARDEREYAAAHRLLAEGLSIRQELGNATGLAVTLDAFGLLAGVQGDLERATFLLAGAHALHEQSGSRPEPAEAARIDALRAKADEKLGSQVFDTIWEKGLAAGADNASRVALEEGSPAEARIPAKVV